ncbi:MAG: altronate dehydratase family protein [Planctomycetota bacterium]|nr:altronate dehydratase family protein [Planctomycetota bacterium]
MNPLPERSALLLHPSDNVGIALRTLAVDGDVTIAGRQVRIREQIPTGHKIALDHLPIGAQVLRYGAPIGRATREIQPGDWVHSHNLEAISVSSSTAHVSSNGPSAWPKRNDRHFMGYPRENGQYGTRNYIAIISNVNCSASVCRYVARHFDQSILAEFPHVDGVVAFSHHGGCAVEFNSLSHRMLNRVLAGIARHPNIGGVVMIGLGCEQVTLDHLVTEHQLLGLSGSKAPSPRAPYCMTIQETGGTRRTIEAGIARVMEMLPQVNQARRERVSASELILATNCGGSDGYSGFTANPALGVACDLLVSCGGTAVLAETPEISGAEHLLFARAVSAQVGEKLLSRVNWWHEHTALFGQNLNHNPTQGNKAGGLTTIAEKSLGAVAKAGQSPLVDVVEYADPIRSKGLVFMDTPGFDPASVTGLVAGGAHLVAFTTGRGSCFGCKPSPSLKISSNSYMYQRMQEDMDLDAGRIATGDATVEQVGQEIFEQLLRVASGEKTKSEHLGLGDEEFVPWTVGPTL